MALPTLWLATACLILLVLQGSVAAASSVDSSTASEYLGRRQLQKADGLGGAGAALGMSLGASTPSSAGAGGGVGSTRITQLPPGTYKGPEITADGTVEARPELGNKTCTGCEQGCRALKVATNCKASLDYFDGRWSPVCSDDDSTAKAPCTCIVTCHPQSETQSLDTAPRPSKQSGAIGRWPGQVMLVFPAVALSLLLSVWG